MVMLLIIAYFSYRSARFATLDNCRPSRSRPRRSRSSRSGRPSSSSPVASTCRWAASSRSAPWRPRRRSRTPGTALAVGPGRRWSSDCCRRDQRFLVVARSTCRPSSRRWACSRRPRAWPTSIGGGAPINGLPGDFGKIANTQILGAADPGARHDRRHRRRWRWCMARTSYGMRVYAVGGNPVAAQIAGVKTGRILFSVYALSGAARRAVRRHAGLARHLRAAQPGSGLRTGRHRRRRHRRRQPARRPGQHLGHRCSACC